MLQEAVDALIDNGRRGRPVGTREPPIEISFSHVERETRSFPSKLARKTGRLLRSFSYRRWSIPENVPMWSAKRNGDRIVQTIRDGSLFLVKSRQTSKMPNAKSNVKKTKFGMF